MEPSDKLVSIIVPVYNAGNYIEETIRMVEAQTYKNWELILVEDCSSDNSRQVIKDYLSRRAGGEESKDRSQSSKQNQSIRQSQGSSQSQSSSQSQDSRQSIRLVEKSRNEGAARARNTGIDEAKGRFIAFLDADDIWMPRKLEKEMAFMEEKKAAFVFTSYEFGNEQAVPGGKVVHAPEMLTYKQALSRTVIFTTTVLLDTEKTGKELIHMPEVKSEDTALWWKILRNGFVAYGLDEVLAIYRRPAGSLSANKLEAIKRIWNLYRREEQLSLVYSIYNFIFWAFRAALRRI